jgi:hypothetical protein
VNTISHVLIRLLVYEGKLITPSRLIVLNELIGEGISARFVIYEGLYFLLFVSELANPVFIIRFHAKFL